MRYSLSAFAAVVALFVSVHAGAQAILPTSWNFDVAAPAGWSESLGTSNTRYANGQSGQACRLDATGDYVLVEFAEEPGVLTYYIKGQNTGGTWDGTFTIQESPDGVNFTTLRSLVDGAVNSGSFVLFTDQPLSTSRFIRFFFTEKMSGHNLALDEIALGTPSASAAQEINVSQGGSNVPSGFTWSIGNAVSTDFSIENLGLADDLIIDDITLTGTDAAEFGLSVLPTSVTAGDAETLTLFFSNAGSGSRFCTITIFSNDATEPEYVINIYAIAGDFATEPTAQAANLTFPNLVSWDFNVSFTAGSPVAEQYIVLRKKGAPVTETPADGTTYVKGAWIGGAQVVYTGPAATFNARNIEASTAYHFAVFAGNGPAGFENYLTDAPLTGSVTTPGPNIGTYYAGVDHNSPNFVSQLNAALNPADYFQIFYSNYTSTLINQFYVQDTVMGGVPMNMVKCRYSDVPYIYAGGFQWSGSGDATLSREHTYPQSWMPTYFDADFEDSEEVSDLHNLHPVLQDECNAVRSNYPYGDVVNPNSTFMETAYGENSLGQDVYEPRDAFKGNSARSVMYQATKYNSTSEDFSLPEQISIIIPYGQSEYLLKSWHFNDLPDNAEIARNEYIETEQNNRNGFIDSIQFPCFIRFATMTKWQPQFTSNNGVLTAIDPGISYQWYYEGEAIEGANAATFTATQNGTYALEVQQFEQCPAITSSGTSVIVDNVGELSPMTDILVYPNPTQGEVAVLFSTTSAEPLHLKVVDLAGKVVRAEQKSVSPGKNILGLDATLPAGVYMLEMHQSGYVHSTRLVVQ